MKRYSSLAILLLACGKHAPPAAPTPAAVDDATRPASTKAESKSDPALASCHASFKAGSDPSADVDTLAKGCADATKMKQMGTTTTGEGNEKSGWKSMPFPAAAGKCYRVYAVAESSAQDVDLMLVDSAGGMVAQDTSGNATPVLLEDGKICFKAADTATLKIRIEAGGGKYAIQVWSD